MPFSFMPYPVDRFARSTLRKVLVCVCALILALQLIGSAFHKHDPSETLPDCVSCHVAAQPLADIPAIPATVLAVLLVVAYLLALRPKLPVVVVRRYLTPPRQAPPSR